MSKIIIKTWSAAINVEELMSKRDGIVKLYEDMIGLRRTKKYPENHIFDEEKSVRWNKEEVIRLNSELESKIKVASEKYKKADNDWINLVIETGMKNYGFSRKMVERAWEKACEAACDYGYIDILNSFEDYLDYALEMLQFAIND